MDSKLFQALLGHAKAVSPHECCGVIVQRNGVSIYQPMMNMTDQPHQQFKFKPEEWAAVEDTGDIQAICHSHPFANPKPSPADKVMCELSGIPWHIVNPQTGELYSFAPSGYQQPLEGRDFIWGIFDCLSLMRDYYKRILAIDTPDIDHGVYGWWNDPDAPELYLDNFKSHGFHEIPVEEVRVNDILLMEVRSKAHKVNHGAIWIDKLPGRGGNLILHHAEGQKSEYTVYGGFWRKCTRTAIRHNSLA